MRQRATSCRFYNSSILRTYYQYVLYVQCVNSIQLVLHCLMTKEMANLLYGVESTCYLDGIGFTIG